MLDIVTAKSDRCVITQAITGIRTRAMEIVNVFEMEFRWKKDIYAQQNYLTYNFCNSNIENDGTHHTKICPTNKFLYHKLLCPEIMNSLAEFCQNFQ